MTEKMFDVVEVNIETSTVRVLERNKSERNAEAIMKMAVIRRGIENTFFAEVAAGKYSDGDQYMEPV